MEYKKFNDKYILRLNKGEEIISSITKLCQGEDIKLGSIIGIGAVNEVEMGLFNTVEKQYHKKTLIGAYEITSLIGNITRKETEVYLHIHINVGDEDLNVYGGHLNRAIISATAEIIITVIDGNINRYFDEEIGLNLLKY